LGSPFRGVGHSGKRSPGYNRVLPPQLRSSLILALHLHWLFVILPVLVVFQACQARREAKVLQEKFGQAYLNYRKQTWF